MTQKALYLCLCLCILLLSACGQPANPTANLAWPTPLQPDYWPTQGWRASTPEVQGVDSGKLADLFAAIRQRKLNVHSVLIARNGYLIAEAYFQPYQAGDRHQAASITKSVVGALAGIAVGSGKLKGVDQTVLDLFPERKIQNLDERKRAMTVENLLALNTGLDCQDGQMPAEGMYAKEGWVQYMLDLPMKDAPGTTWRYCSGAAHLLSAVVERATFRTARQYANQTLFPALGIGEVKPDDWPADPQGTTQGLAGLFLSPQEIARFGQLYLQKGIWEGKQLLPAGWVDTSTREHAFIGKDTYVGGLDRRWGYMFSLFPAQRFYGYLGQAGQELFVLPDQNMVVVFTAALPLGSEKDLLPLVTDFIQPAAKSTKALPANTSSQVRLGAEIQKAAGIQQAPAGLPALALEISGKTFQLKPNPNGWTDMTWVFKPGAGEGTVRLNSQIEYAVGLDGLYRRSLNPGAREVALRGEWIAPDTLHQSDINIGDYYEADVLVKFSANHMTMSMTLPVAPGSPMILEGELK